MLHTFHLYFNIIHIISKEILCVGEINYEKKNS